MVLCARLVRVKGRLQAASGVIHVVAEEIEDLSWRLGELFGDTRGIDFSSPADEARREVVESRAKGKVTSSLVRLVKEMPELKRDLEELSKSAGKLMPKGRNFH